MRPVPFLLRCGLLLLAVALLGLGGGCALLEAPQRPVVPTPPAALAEGDAIDFEVMVSEAPPAGDDGVQPAVDPSIAALVDSVSRQNLFAYVQTLADFGTRHTLSVADQPEQGIGAARSWIYEEFNRVGAGRLEVSYQDYPLTYGGSTTTQRNVIATLPGTGDHPGTVVLMAHYDSRAADVDDAQSLAPGANDNGSGVAVLLEAARLLSAGEWNQTIIFAAFSAFEQGTFGSKHFVQEVMLDGMIIDAAINNDIVGGRSGIPASVRLFASGPTTSASSQLGRYIEFVGNQYVPTFPVVMQQALDREGRFGDQREFVNVGVPAVRLTESLEDFGAQRSSADTPEKIDYSYLAQVARINVAAVATMAGAPPPPLQPTVAAMAGEGSYLLSWTLDERAAGYALVARPVDGEEGIYRFVKAKDAGSVVLAGLDPGTTYGISVAALDRRGRMSLFSPEVLTP